MNLIAVITSLGIAVMLTFVMTRYWQSNNYMYWIQLMIYFFISYIILGTIIKIIQQTKARLNLNEMIDQLNDDGDDILNNLRSQPTRFLSNQNDE